MPRRRDAKTSPPKEQAWLFWDVDVATIDLVTHAHAVIPRVLERGRLVDVRWLLSTYGREAIHRFLRDTGHPELSDKTLTFWRAALQAKGERWATPRASRPLSSAPWID